MYKAVIIFLLFFTISCSDNDIDNSNLLPNVPVNMTVFLNNPEFINLQVPGGWAYANGGIKGLIIYRLNSSTFIAFDRASPHLTPNDCSQMTVNYPAMVCPCDDSKYQIIDGAPMTDGIHYFAKQYLVNFSPNTGTLRITNY